MADYTALVGSERWVASACGSSRKAVGTFTGCTEAMVPDPASTVVNTFVAYGLQRERGKSSIVPWTPCGKVNEPESRKGHLLIRSGLTCTLCPWPIDSWYRCGYKYCYFIRT